jgi:hypothetical protein
LNPDNYNVRIEAYNSDGGFGGDDGEEGSSQLGKFSEFLKMCMI